MLEGERRDEVYIEQFVQQILPGSSAARAGLSLFSPCPAGETSAGATTLPTSMVNTT